MSNESNSDGCYQSRHSLTLFNQQLMAHIKDTNKNDFFHFLNQPNCKQLMKQFPYEVLTSVISFMHSKDVEQNKIVYNSCEKVLHFLVIYCEPSELLIYLIEQMELSISKPCFFSLLNPIQICLLRCKNPLLVIDMCIDNVKKFLLHLELPNDEDKNQTSATLEQIVLSYINISNFIDNLYHELKSFYSNSSSNLQSKIKYIILELLLSLFGKPISFINLNSNNHQLLFQKILKNILSIECDIFYFFRFFHYENFCKYTSFTEKKTDINNHNIQILLNVNDLSFSNFYWTVLHEILETRTLKIYNPYYVAYNCINISNYMMTYKEQRQIIIFKGLDLLCYAIKVLKNFLIPFEDLDLMIHDKVIRNLTHCIIYGNTSQIKQYAATNFINYINSFSNKAKYVIMNRLISLDYHSKIKGLVIGIVKNIVADSLISLEKKSDNYENELFAGPNLQLIISNICVLKQGNNTDILEISDQIIIILNFILFLIIRNKSNSGIMNFLEKTNYEFLKSVKSAVETQKMQCMLRLENITMNKDVALVSESKGILSDGFDFMTADQKCKMYNQAVNTLLLIENRLQRINDFLDN